MGSVRFGIPLDLAEDIIEARGIRAAVETGTYKGESAALLRSLCPRVWTIELSPAQHAEAAASHAGISGLEFLQGNSAALLPELLEHIGEPVLFWLDGHVMPGDPDFGATECPVISEIAAVNESVHGRDACILIDDAVLFHAAPPFGLHAAEWPMITEVIDLLRAVGDRYVTVLDDVVIAGPPEIRAIVDQWWARVVADRGGTTTMVPLHRLEQAWNPTPVQAVRRLAKSLLRSAPDRFQPRRGGTVRRRSPPRPTGLSA